MQEYLSHASGSVIRARFYARGSVYLAQGSWDHKCKRSHLMQGYLPSDARGSMSHARGSGIKRAEYMTQQWLVIRFRVETMQETSVRHDCA